MRRFAWKRFRLLVIAASIVALLSTPMRVNAQGERWHGVAAWYNAPSTVGTSVPDMYVAPGFTADYQYGGFIGQVLWQGTDNDPGLNTWVEEGYTYGWKKQDILTWYYAENLPNGGGYDEHQITSQTPTVGQYNDVEIYWAYPYWEVALNGALEGIERNNGCCGESMETGVESTSAQSSLHNALSDGIAYRPYGGSWISGWGSGTGLYQDWPAYAQWQLQYVNLLDGM